MSDARRLAAMVVATIGFGVVVFGVVRGLSETGPAHGTRLIVSIASPIDVDVLAMAKHTTSARLGANARVIVAGENLVVEVADDASEDLVAILERTGRLEVRDGSTVVLDGAAIKHAEVLRGGVALEVTDASRIKINVPLAVVLDDKVRTTVTADRATGTEVHVLTPGTTEDDVYRAAQRLVDMVEAGAAHPLHVVRHDRFTRATGFIARAWLFFVVGGVMLVIALVLGLRRGARA